MAWSPEARNRSTEVRNVNYHEDVPSRGSRKGSSGNNGGGGMNKFGKAVICGVALYCLGSAGLGWIGDTIGNVKDGIELAQEIKQTEKLEKKDIKNSEKAKKKIADDINEQGYTVKFDLESIEAEDVQEVLECVSDFVTIDEGIEIKEENIIYLSSEALENSTYYETSILKRLKQYSEPVAFVVICESLSEKEQDKFYENASFIINNNLQTHGSIFNNVSLHGYMGVPDYDNLTLIVLFSVE